MKPSRQPFDFSVDKFPPLPRLKGLMVTGTDTGVGKTLVAGAIAQYFRHAGKSVGVFKPIATGCRRRREGLFSEDGEFLSACADSRQSLAQIVPICLGPAMSPNIAVRRAGLAKIDLQIIFDAYAAMRGQSDVTIVEGVGGLLCPITDDFWVIHFARLIQLPIVIVARPGLGTINHTLLTIHAARSAGLCVAGVVINGYQIEPQRQRHLTAASPAQAPATDDELSELNNPDQIARLGKVDILAIVPQEAGNSVLAATIGKDTQFAVKQISWERLLENS
jgi:dethiobiotin synthetase